MRASRPVSPAHDSFTNLHPTCNHPGTHARYAARTMATSQHTSGMTPSVVAFLSDERKPYSRIRSVEEAGAFGLSISWLDPQHFDLLVDERSPRTYYRSRPLSAPAAFAPRTGSDTSMFARSVIRQMESTPGVVVVNSSEAVMAAGDKLLSHQALAAASVPFPKTV